jgi:hypothetical protein
VSILKRVPFFAVLCVEILNPAFMRSYMKFLAIVDTGRFTPRNLSPAKTAFPVVDWHI